MNYRTLWTFSTLIIVKFLEREIGIDIFSSSDSYRLKVY